MPIEISKVSVGDFCWFKKKNITKPVNGEIKKIYANENAVNILAEPPLGGFHTISCNDCWWDKPNQKRMVKKIARKRKADQKERKTQKNKKDESLSSYCDTCECDPCDCLWGTDEEIWLIWGDQ